MTINKVQSVALFGLIMVGLSMVAATCADAESIENANEAAKTEEAGSGRPDDQSTGEQDIFDVRTGDCLGEVFTDETVESSTIDVVDCDGASATSRVTSLFVVGKTGGAYPGEPYFDDQMLSRCDEAATAFLFPTAESWDAGDRTIVCVEEY